MVITKFLGRNIHNGRVNNYQAVIEVEKDGVTRTIRLPIYCGTASIAASVARRWRKIPGNMKRIEEAFDAKTDIKAKE